MAFTAGKTRWKNCFPMGNSRRLGESKYPYCCSPIFITKSCIDMASKQITEPTDENISTNYFIGGTKEDWPWGYFLLYKTKLKKSNVL